MAERLLPNDLISVIITTYNWPEALACVLFALNNQSDARFEVLVVDDGSTETNQQAVNLLKQKINFPMYYLWQEDRGFRAARARNMGILHTKGKYLVFLDGDCIPSRDFIAQHRKLAEIGHLVTGHRVILSESFSQIALQQIQTIKNKGWLYWLVRALNKQSNKLIPTFRSSKLNRYRKLTQWQGAQTCNLATWRKDVLDICGFDEQYQGWGYEDSDFVIRLFNHGIKRKSGKWATEVFHLWHEEAPRGRASENFAKLNQILTSKRTQASQSILQKPQSNSNDSE